MRIDECNLRCGNFVWFKLPIFSLKKSGEVFVPRPFLEFLLNLSSSEWFVRIWIFGCRETLAVTRWWFQIFKTFSLLPGEDDPIWRAYFSDGLVQSPSRLEYPVLLPDLICWVGVFFRTAGVLKNKYWMCIQKYFIDFGCFSVPSFFPW